MAQETKSTEELWNELAEKNKAPNWYYLEPEVRSTIIDLRWEAEKIGIKEGAETIEKAHETLNTKNK